MRAGSVLIQQARLVSVGSPAPTDQPADIRIRDGFVSDVGPQLRRAGEEPVIEAAGRWAIPGLWDQHVHMGQWAQRRNRLDVSGTTSPKQVTEIVADHVATTADRNTVVLGAGYRSATWPQQPTVAELDAVSGDRPVILISGDGHNGWLNSSALQLFGVAPRTGPLAEREWFELYPRIAELPGAQSHAAYRMVVVEAAARGVVGIVDMEFEPGYLRWPERFGGGLDQLRVRTAAYPDRLDDVIAAGLRTGEALPRGNGLLTMGPLKIIADGSLNTRTAFCYEPYATATSLEFPRGKLNYSPEELVNLLGRATERGLQVAVHAIGDAAATSVLDAFESSGARGSIEHAQLITDDDIARLAHLGVHASVQPAHLLDDRDVALQCWPGRADHCFPLRSMIESGVVVALGSDAPVAALDPWLAMAAAVHRSADEREPWNPAEAVSAAEALAATTDGQRTVAPGNRGDVVLLDDDPLRPLGDSAAMAAHLRNVRVAATFVAGRATHLAVPMN